MTNLCSLYTVKYVDPGGRVVYSDWDMIWKP